MCGDGSEIDNDCRGLSRSTIGVSCNGFRMGGSCNGCGSVSCNDCVMTGTCSCDGND